MRDTPSAACPAQGFIITTTPTNPTSTAPIRHGPTFSPRIGIDSSVIISGATKNSAVASASGITASAAKKLMFEITTITPRSTCSPGVLVLSRCNPPSQRTSSRLNRMPIEERMNTIWCNG